MLRILPGVGGGVGGGCGGCGGCGGGIMITIHSSSQAPSILW